MPAGLLADLAVSATAFVGTNADNAAVTMVMVVTAPPSRARRVIIGQLSGFGFLVAVAAATAAILFEIPAWVVGLLGAVPLAIGFRGLVLLARGEHRDPSRRAVGTGYVAAALVTVGAGGDNLAAYIPLLRTGGITAVAATVAVFVAGEVLLTLFVLWTGRHPRSRPVYEKLHAGAGPILSCVVGLVVMWWAGTV
ncbi:MAG TPA: cadmium resistance transporter [Acidimicrobiales bacterium]|nr:cadmium resistance transporter [Acidimicrobiales bacterium]